MECASAHSWLPAISQSEVRTGLLDRFRSSLFQLLEVVDEELRQLLLRRVVGVLVAPRLARREDVARHVRALARDLEAEDLVLVGLGLREIARVDAVEDGARVAQAHALAHAEAAARPARVHEPRLRAVLLQ